MERKGTLWLLASYLLLLLPTTSTCFLQSSLTLSSCEKSRYKTKSHNAVQNTLNFQDIANQGITSLLQEESSGTIIAGTKSGEIFQSIDNAVTWRELSGYDHKPKYPVYSLAVQAKDGKVERIFGGRGDRYISVWDAESKEYVQRLGPHTGWVQDLAYDENSQILYSIGCNCIEMWDCSGRDTSDNGSIRHMTKLSVENSVSACTLSSDLLRLCLVDLQHLTAKQEGGRGTGGQKHLLLSSGVDGRIHCWSAATQAFLVHQGRINAMTYSKKSQILFSVGNDGRLCASRIHPETMAIEVVYELELKGSPRLTSLAIVEEMRNQKLLLVVGTTDGDLIDVAVTINSTDSSITMTEGERTNIYTDAKIYAVLPLPKGTILEPESQEEDTRMLLVGHAKGMVLKSRCPAI